MLEAGEECAGSRSVRPILGIKAQDGRIVTSDQDKAEILNEHFSTIGEKLANEFPPFSEEDGFTHITRVTPTIMNIELTHDAIGEGLQKLKADKACGPDKVAPRLLKAAGDTIIPSLISIYKSSASRNLVPDKWKVWRTISAKNQSRVSTFNVCKQHPTSSGNIDPRVHRLSPSQNTMSENTIQLPTL